MRIDVRRGGVWIDVVVVAAIVAVGTVVAGVTNNAPPDVGAIPGCDVVVPAEEGFSFSIGFYEGRYDNPDYPWLTSAKASAMSNALIESLPTDVEVEFAPPSKSFVFQPMNIYPKGAEIADGVTVEDISGDSTASGVVVRGETNAPLSVSAEAWDGEVPPCTEGRVDERTTLLDGTVVDTLDAVAEYDGVSTHRRTATAYFSDTVVSARTSNEGIESMLPLEVDELRDIVSNNELRVSAEVPSDTPPALHDCGSIRENSGPPLSRDDVERVGAALAEQWAIIFPNARTDRPIGDLVPGSYGGGSVCNTVKVTTESGSTEMTVDISVREGAERRGVEGPDSPGVTRTTLPDGTIVTQWSDGSASVDQTTEAVSVLRPSNTLVEYRFGEGLDVGSLIALASTPGLDL